MALVPGVAHPQYVSYDGTHLREFDQITDAALLFFSETCTIAPSELHTRLFEQKLQYPTDTNSNVDRDEDDNHEGKDGRGKKSEVTISKMVDWCLGLELSPQEDSLVSAAWRQINYWNEHSLNQSLSFIKKTPLFADVEIKKTQQSSNPEIQLAIWGSGADQKRKHHGWDTSMPMPGITIEGHTWRYYLFTKIGPDLVSALLEAKAFHQMLTIL